MMKKAILSVCAASLLCTSVMTTAPRRAYAGATDAYIAHTVINTALLAIGYVMFYGRKLMHESDLLPESPFSFWPMMNYAGIALQFANAGVTAWMDKSGQILAQFVGDEGHVTDKWIGPPELNKTIEAMDAFSAELKQFDLSNVPVMHDAYVEADMDLKTATAQELTDALVDWNLAKDQSNQGIQEHQAKILYTAQQQAIWAMVEALYMKKTFAILASVHQDTEAAIQNQYQNTKSTLATLAARRALFNSLLIVKYQVARARTRIRSEALKRYIKPVSTAPEISTPVIDPTAVVNN
ncbi:MAG: hypothetical protein J6Y85_00640 [Alphaproteobacteria bacterium]|nr:hypothetical protein [Alphaproteobacteria bacterium]